VSVGESFFVFDCGPGAVRAVSAAGLPWSTISMMFFTHFHTDHIGDLTALLFALNIPDVNRTEPLFLFGPPGMKKLYNDLVTAFGDWLVPKRFELTTEELEGQPLEGATWRVETAPAEHSQPAYAYRLEAEGAAIVYSGDSDYSEQIIQLADRCDLLILECSYPNEIEIPGHLTPRKAGEMAARARCKKLALTHMYPISADYDLAAQCRQAYDGDVVVAEDGIAFEVGMTRPKR
jgi:ribonuclease BN (tRNA processing enzyme)